MYTANKKKIKLIILAVLTVKALVLNSLFVCIMSLKHVSYQLLLGTLYIANTETEFGGKENRHAFSVVVSLIFFPFSFSLFPYASIINIPYFAP